MKALRWTADKDRVELERRQQPTNAGKDNVIVKVAYSGICGTDLHIMQKEFPAAKEVTLGHEFSGTIISTGENVMKFKKGDQVVINPNSSCGTCHFCTRGKVNYCTTGGLRSTIGLFSDGGWAEYCEVPAKNVGVIPEKLSLKTAILCEPYSCIVRGWNNNNLLPDDTDILIMGAGIIGLLWANLFHHHGYRDVTVMEPQEARRKIAEGMGLGFKIITPDAAKERFIDNTVKDEVEGFGYAEESGFDLIVDCSGNPKAIEAAFPWLRRGGTLNVFGCCPKKSSMQINPAQFMMKEVTVTGSLINPFTFPQTISLVANMAEKYLEYRKLGMKTYQLDDYEKAFTDLKNGSISKAVFEFPE